MAVEAGGETGGIAARVALIQALIPLGLDAVEEELQQEVEALAGKPHARQGRQPGVVRWGEQRGSVYLADQKLPVVVPRVRDRLRRVEIPPESYRQLQQLRALDEGLFRRLLGGLACREYAACAEAVPAAFGLSASTVWRRFVRASARRLRELQERSLAGERWVALFLDGKTFAEDQVVIALGVTLQGAKRVLGLVQTARETLDGFALCRPAYVTLLPNLLPSSRVEHNVAVWLAFRSAHAKNCLDRRVPTHRYCERARAKEEMGGRPHSSLSTISNPRRPTTGRAIRSWDSVHPDLLRVHVIGVKAGKDLKGREFLDLVRSTVARKIQRQLRKSVSEKQEVDFLFQVRCVKPPARYKRAVQLRFDIPEVVDVRGEWLGQQLFACSVYPSPAAEQDERKVAPAAHYPLFLVRPSKYPLGMTPDALRDRSLCREQRPACQRVGLSIVLQDFALDGSRFAEGDEKVARVPLRCPVRGDVPGHRPIEVVPANRGRP